MTALPGRSSLPHQIFDKFYPLIRFVYERVYGHEWFSKITPVDGIDEELWLGGAPDTPNDYAFIVDRGIKSVLNIRAERDDDIDFYQQHGINYLRLFVLDVSVPDQTTIDKAVEWIAVQSQFNNPVLIHCAKGRGRSATILAAYLMSAHGMTYDETANLIKSKRKLTKLEKRHKKILNEWINETG
jgi:protein tyrosine phosphatase (PTP) superfamily phosphohydrolase (DUF442 family)